MGKVYFTMWSMDVKFEGENVVRNMDMTTHNHGSNTNTAPWSYLDRMGNAPAGSCSEEKKKVDEECPKAKDNKNAKPHCPPTKRLDAAYNNWEKVRKRNKKAGMTKTESRRSDSYKKARDRTKAAVDDHGERMKKNDCQQALRCFMPPYNEPADPPPKVNSRCCNGQTGHHLVPRTTVKGACPGYSHDDAPVVCAEGRNQSHGTHKKLHDQTDKALMRLATAKPPKVVGGKVAYADLRDAVVGVMQRVFGAGCSKDCLEAQLDKYYEKACGANCKLNANNKQGIQIGGGTAKKKI